MLCEDPLILLDILDHRIVLYDPMGVLQDLLKRFQRKLQASGAEKIVLEEGSWA